MTVDGWEGFGDEGFVVALVVVVAGGVAVVVLVGVVAVAAGGGGAEVVVVVAGGGGGVEVGVVGAAGGGGAEVVVDAVVVDESVDVEVVWLTVVVVEPDVPVDDESARATPTAELEPADTATAANAAASVRRLRA